MMADMTDRPVWFPGNAAPPHLDGSLPGDFGCAFSCLFRMLFCEAPCAIQWSTEAKLHAS